MTARRCRAGSILYLQPSTAIRKRLAAFVHDGRLTYREDVQHGFEHVPTTFRRLFTGQNRGKQLLALDPVQGS